MWEVRDGLVKILLLGGGGGGAAAWSPPKFREGGVAERGSKGHTLISSMQVSENCGSNLLMGWGGGAQGCIRRADNGRRNPPPPLGVTGTGTDCGSASGFVMGYA